jgi:hypothetical protein
MEHLNYWQMATILLGGLGTLAIFSFLLKENPFYRFFEHLYIGIAAGFGLVGGIKGFLYPMVIVPLFGLDIVQYPDGTFSAAYDKHQLFFLLPMAFGLLYYFIFSERYSWLAKIVIGFTLGVSGGMAFDGFFTEIMPQITSSFKPLVVFVAAPDALARSVDWRNTISNCVFVITLLSVMYYFFFSFKPAVDSSLHKVSYLGRWLMMVCFGAFFGSTVMARMALLVERLQFLTGDFAQAVRQLLMGS